MYKITFYAPEEHVDSVKNAMFKAGAGKVGNYCCCSWQVLGEGQFLPLEGSAPHLGEKFRLETVAEYKIEMVCVDECIQDAVIALRSTHPYEEPAYQVVRLEDIAG